MNAQHAFRLALVSVLEGAGKGGTRRELADRLAISESQLSKLMSGSLFPSLKLLLQLEDVVPGITLRIFREYKRLSAELGVERYRAPRTRAARDQPIEENS